MSEPRICQFCWSKGRNIPAQYEMDEDFYCTPCLRDAGYEPSEASHIGAIERKLDMETGDTCKRGCGKPTHRGVCAGSKRKANGDSKPQQQTNGETVMVKMHVSRLDQWWAALTAAEKAELFAGGR